MNYKIDFWNIKLAHNLTLYGNIRNVTEKTVYYFSDLIDSAASVAEKLELENEFISIMKSHDIGVMYGTY